MNSPIMNIETEKKNPSALVSGMNIKTLLSQYNDILLCSIFNDMSLVLKEQ